MDFKINKINRRINFDARVYFNSGSFNRPTDTGPRFFVKPHKLNFIERVGFSRQAEKRNDAAIEYGNRFWGNYLGEKALSDTEVEAIFEEVKTSYPYGYSPTDTSDEIWYTQDVKYNRSFQGHYSKYWNRNLDLVQQPEGFDEIQYPYIEFKTDEFIQNKHVTGTVPDQGTLSLYTESLYTSQTQWLTDSVDPNCGPRMLDVVIGGEPGDDPAVTGDFHVNGLERDTMFVNASGTQYFVRLKAPWPTGADGAYVDRHLKFSELPDGEEWTPPLVSYLDHDEFTLGVTVTTKVNHPLVGLGHTKGFLIELVEGTPLAVKRGSRYTFDLSDESNFGHELYITTSDVGAGAGEFCQFVQKEGTIAYDATLTWDVPLDAPDTLYYGCHMPGHEKMGGTINVYDPASLSDASKPGQGIVLQVPTSISEKLFNYYCPEKQTMGGVVWSTDGCVNQDCK